MRTIKDTKKRQLDLATDLAAGRILDKVLGYAVSEEIDEMIFSSSDQGASVSFYDAGHAKGGLKLAPTVKRSLFSALKEISGASVDRRGDFKRDFLGGKVVFSVSVYGSRESEKIIVSLERGRFEVMSVGQLGFEKKVLGRVKQTLEERRKGLVLVIGPFDSGKTSTLYGFVSHINSPEINISTFEHRIGLDLPSVNQSAFGDDAYSRRALSLSSIMRQDPDVVMIDEANDKDALEAAIHLADRGYFVLAGVYGRDFATTLDFLQGLGVSLSLLVSSVKMVVNQRTAARNCPSCLKRAKLGSDDLNLLKECFDQEAFFAELRERKLVGPMVKGVEDVVFYEGGGCDKCRDKGSAGRVGIFEVLMMNEEVARAVKGGHFGLIDSEIGKQDCFTLPQSALIKAAAGIISPKELLKIIKEIEIT